MRDLLFLAHRIPYPPNKGDKIRSFHILRHLASRFRIHLGCFFDDPEDERHIGMLRSICADVHLVRLGPARKLFCGARALLDGRSVSEACYSDARMANWVHNTLGRHDIRDIFVFCSAVAPNVLGDVSGRRTVLDMVDVDSEKWRAYSRAGSRMLRPLFAYEQRHLLALEKRASAVSEKVLFVSPAEREVFSALAPELTDRLLSLENGVDLARFCANRSYANPFLPSASAIVFTGAMDYRANVDAVVWFGREIFPAVRREHPRAEFWIVGANPTARVRRLARQQGIRVTGTVDDVRAYIAHAACVVAPLRIARGVQNKVLEAMALAKAVVISPAALEGLHAVHGRDVLVGEGSEDLFRHVSDVLAGRWPDLGGAARKYVEQHHDWSENLRLLDQIFPGTAASAPADVGYRRGQVLSVD